MRLFHIMGERKQISVTQVPLKKGNLNSEDVFVIDCGLRIYQVCSYFDQKTIPGGLMLLISEFVGSALLISEMVNSVLIENCMYIIIVVRTLENLECTWN